LVSIPVQSACLPTNPISSLRRIEAMSGHDMRAARPGPGLEEGRDQGLDDLVGRVARGDQDAFEALYDRLAGPAYGLIRKVVRDQAQSEEVTQEALLEVWRTASRFDPARGSAATWVMTIAHRRAVDRVRSATAATEREHRTAQPLTANDEVAETAVANLEAERVRRCLGGLTDLQRESITLAYYGGYTYPEVAGLLHTALGTVKTRIRDGLIRLRDCMGVSW
jgi:RNA polymerase sigma-70 factor (ECF subfamily)